MIRLLFFVSIISLAAVRTAAANGEEGATRCGFFDDDCGGGTTTSSSTEITCPDGYHNTNGACYSNDDSGDDSSSGSPSSWWDDPYENSDTVHRTWKPHAESRTITRYRPAAPTPRDERWDYVRFDNPAPLPIQMDEETPTQEERTAYDRDMNNTNWVQESMGCVPFFCGNSALDRQMSAWLQSSEECTPDNDFCGAANVMNEMEPNSLASRHFGETKTLFAKLYRLASNPFMGPDAFVAAVRQAMPRILGGSLTTIVDFFAKEPKTGWDYFSKVQFIRKVAKGEVP